MYNWLFTKTPLVFLVQSFWRDEAFSYFLAKKNLIQILALTVKDFSPPYYYLVIHFWMLIFGNSELALRSVSFIFYWATVYVGFLFLNEILKFKLGKSFFYTFIIAINPLLLYYAFEARMYSMFAFFSVLSFYSLYKKNSRLYLFSTVLGLFTHYFMIPVVILQYFLKKSKEQFIAGLIFLPWLIYIFINKGLGFTAPFWIENTSKNNFINFVGSLYTGYELSFGFLNNYILGLSLAIILFVVYGFIKSKGYKTHDKKIFYFLFAWAFYIPLFTILISFIKPLFLPRYLIFANVGLLLLLIHILEKMPVFIKYVLIVLLLIVTLSYQYIQIKFRTKADFRKIVSEIKAISNKNDLLYVSSELDYFTAQYYFDENRVFIWNKSYDEIPDYIGKVLIPENKVINSLPIYPNKAFVLDSQGNYTIEAVY